MANEIPYFNESGLTLYFQVWSEDGQVWSAVAVGLDDYDAADIADYAIGLAETEASGHYLGDEPVEEGLTTHQQRHLPPRTFSSGNPIQVVLPLLDVHAP